MDSRPLKLCLDENIPFGEEALHRYGTVRRLPGRSITASEVRLTDALLVRSVTTVNARLLEESHVQFVGSATIGTDHVDLSYLRECGIAFAHAPGSNADSVVEYVLAALLHLASRFGEGLGNKTIGIVGCGNIGGRLAARLPAFGLRVLKNDPPLAEQAEAADQTHDFVSLDALLAEADIVTLHVPLVREGRHATHHLFDEARLRQMRPGAWLVNAARGAAIDNAALERVLADGQLGAAVLDVWEGEPTPRTDLLRRTALATPHIAGYSFDGKVQGTVMLYRALIAHFGLPDVWDAESVLAPGQEDQLTLLPPSETASETAWLHELVRSMYDIAADDARLRHLLERPPEAQGAYFSGLRRDYPRRRAFDRHTISASVVPPLLHQAVAEGLRVQLTGS